ncbi:hypothetical protein O7623_19905 [Solwaraspora sp. WMMD791]|uniref:hypothetical protein n=1 Tax=Solwaraspora sp. WMMD791 TaxID=3016086 RepID=UPI002499CDC7|nr:hypothetical protein [Solwaraspora sp. WMMD791]WFE25635.1 hypothetical protein O7623_19905 [Solwaraspora sp. WMMD791]
MDYRDWEYGDRAPRERRPAPRWSDDAEVDPTPRSRRARYAESGDADEPPRGRRRRYDPDDEPPDRGAGPGGARWALPAGPSAADHWQPTDHGSRSPAQDRPWDGGRSGDRDRPADWDDRAATAGRGDRGDQAGRGDRGGRHRDGSWQIPEQPTRSRRRTVGRRRAPEDPISGGPISGSPASGGPVSPAPTSGGRRGWQRDPPLSDAGPVSRWSDEPRTSWSDEPRTPWSDEPSTSWSAPPARWSPAPGDRPADDDSWLSRGPDREPDDLADAPPRRRRRRSGEAGPRRGYDDTAQWLPDDAPPGRRTDSARRPVPRQRAIGGRGDGGPGEHTVGWSRDDRWSAAADHTSEWSRDDAWSAAADYTSEWTRPPADDRQRESGRAVRRTRAARREIEAPRREQPREIDGWSRTASAPRAIGPGPSAAPTSAGRGHRDGGDDPALFDGWRAASDYTQQWDRDDDPQSWPTGSRTGARKRRALEAGGYADEIPPVDPWPEVEPGREGTFWSGTRLAADDPRWVETPSSAPRSPVVALPSAPRSRVLPEQRPRPRYEPPSQRRLTYRIDDELIDADQGGYLSSLLYTAAWYALPVVAFLIWSLTLDGTPATNDCVLGVDGDCLSARAQAISSLLAAAPAFAYALMISLVLAVLIRWVSGTWRASSVGLAAAVIGGGMSQVVASAITGQPIG